MKWLACQSRPRSNEKMSQTPVCECLPCRRDRAGGPWQLLRAAVLAIVAGVLGCGGSPVSEPVAPDGTNSSAAIDVQSLRPRVTAFCSGCHAVADPQSFPKDAWFALIGQMFDFYYESKRSDLKPPPMNDVVAFYRAQAPDELQLPERMQPLSPKLQWRHQPIPLPEDAGNPAISYVNWTVHSPWDAPALLFCDMRGGQIGRVEFDDDRPGCEILAELDNPDHIETFDLDGDGRHELVVADLGSFLPEDHDRGRVVWLRPTVSGAGWEAIPLLERIGRVTDVQAADFDSDGDLDLVVADFGWRTTGSIRLLRQETAADGRPRFQAEVVDPRHGTIHTPTCDLNGDGHPDFVALVSQEHEVIEAFLNRGDGSFERQTIHAAGDPAHGSSGIQLVDLDGDGDLDVLYSHGDLLDSFYVKPEHGVDWLENRGSYPFQAHRLAALPGAIRALAADLDEDDDLDVVACAFVPGNLLKQHDLDKYDSLVWFEQQQTGRFAPRVLDRGRRGYLGMDLGDFDADGDVDLAVGNYHQGDEQAEDWLTIWWNEGPRRPSSRR